MLDVRIGVSPGLASAAGAPLATLDVVVRLNERGEHVFPPSLVPPRVPATLCAVEWECER